MIWQSIDFSDSIHKIAAGRENQILASEIRPTGRFPVIDQGKEYIAGYSDAKDRVIHHGLPVVVFGDHTRCVKYVDFPFIIGADGTKVLKPKEDIFDPRFFYYALLNLNIPSRGYNRHFTLLKESKLPLPEKPEQRKIALVLHMVQVAIQQQEHQLALTTELKRTLLNKLFTEGINGEAQKQTEIGSLPQSWDVTKLETVAVSFDYGTSIKCEYKQTGYPVLRIPNIAPGFIDLHDLKHGQLKKNETQTLRLQQGDLLFVRTNGVRENAGRCALFRNELNECYFASYLIRVRVDTSKVLPAFVNEYARTEQGMNNLSGRAIRTADGKFNINSGTLKRVILPLPNLNEQHEIIRQLDLVQNKLNLTGLKRDAFVNLFRTLLHQLMTAKIRTHNLDLSELEKQLTEQPTYAKTN